MNLKLIRYSSQSDDTLGVLLIDNRFSCYTLEDEHRDEKVPGETRIPAGTYRIDFRTVGGFHERYGKRFPDMHRGMLWLQDVPGFEYILIHCGNREADTAGCILVGDTTQQNVTQEGFVGASSAAYRRIYPIVSDALMAGETVTIDVEDQA